MVVAAAVYVGGAPVVGGTIGNTSNVDRATVFKIAVAASGIIIVHAAIDIERLPVSGDVARFINQSAVSVAGSWIGVSNTTAHQGGKTQQR